MEIMLVNGRTGDPLATDVEFAVTRATRRRGLLGRRYLAPALALVLAPCAAVHTAFMQFAIDLVFVNRDGRVLKVHYAVPPFRMAGAARAHAVIEMAAGTLRPDIVQRGDLLRFESGGGVETLTEALAKASGSSPSPRSESFSGISLARR
jgi:uncharacterized membrane protein (UPF0127 family)